MRLPARHACGECRASKRVEPIPISAFVHNIEQDRIGKSVGWPATVTRGLMTCPRAVHGTPDMRGRGCPAGPAGDVTLISVAPAGPAGLASAQLVSAQLKSAPCEVGAVRCSREVARRSLAA